MIALSRAPWLLAVPCVLSCCNESSPPPKPPPCPVVASPSPTAAIPPGPPSAASRSADLASAAQAIRSAAATSEHAAEIVRSLTSEVGPRLAGSPGDKLAVFWAVRTLVENGLTGVHPEFVMVPHWERGTESVAIVGPGTPGSREPLRAAALGGSIPTPAAGLEADVLEVASMDEVDKLPKNGAAGKIVFFNTPHMQRTKDGSGYGASVPVRFQGPGKAAAKGAIAAVIRTVGTDEDAPHTGVTDRAPPQIPSFAIANADADKLHAAIAEKKARVRLELKLSSKWLPDVESANVIGDIPATERPDEVVLMGAHLDSWDLATGAIDDGAGCAIVLEAARLLGTLGVRPRRTVRVVLFAAEENELAGGRGYARRHEKELDHHIAAMEADSGTDRVYLFRFLGPADHRALLAPIEAALKPLGIESEAQGGYGGADISPLKKAGVPVLDLAQDFTNYFDNHHTPNDRFDKINKEGLEQAAAAFAIAAWGVAELDGDLGRVAEEKHDAK